MQITWNKGYPATAGGKVVATAYGNGPSSYAGGEAGGDPIYAVQMRSVDKVDGSLTVDGLYETKGQPASAGNPTKWFLRWFFATTGSVGKVTFTAGSGQTNGTYLIPASSGAATVQIVIAGGVITSATIINPGKDYTSAPTFTVSEGGTPGTITATLSTAGQEVPNGANLSTSTTQISVIGS